MKKLIENALKKVMKPHQYVFFHDTVRSRFPTKKQRERFEQRCKFYSSFVSPNDLCFDVGANIGNRVSPLLKIGAKVIAIEPQTDCARHLRKKFGSRIEIIEKGLGSTIGVQNFYVSDASVLSSFSKDWIDAINERFSDNKWTAPIPVEITTLDFLIEEYGVPSFIKIDVEGFELEVLKGLSKPIPMISFEYNVPENSQTMIDCIHHVKQINENIEFNYCVGEEMKFALEKWMSFEEILQCVKTKDFTNFLSGDIYVRTIL